MEDELLETNAPIDQIKAKNVLLQKNSKIYDERRAQ